MSESQTTGTEWWVEHVAKVTDGDTVRLVRSRDVELDGHTYRLTDDEADGIPIRLVWVDTPERGDHPGWEKARADLSEWITKVSSRPEALRVICYESAGWDRLLGDLIDADGNSASQWLMTEKNWPPYVKGK
jgi:endonuclease YncB( thermonuclease family)